MAIFLNGVHIILEEPKEHVMQCIMSTSWVLFVL